MMLKHVRTSERVKYTLKHTSVARCSGP